MRALNAGTGGGDARFRLLPEPFVGVLSDAAVRDRPGVAGVSCRSDRRFGSLCRGRGVVGAEACRLGGKGDRRAPRRSADVHAALWLAGAQGRVGACGCDGTVGLCVAPTRLARFRRSRGVSSRRFGVEPPTKTFLAYSDLSAFADSPTVPVPAERRVVFVGALEPYKNVDGLAAAWRRVSARELPDAVLVIVGRGSRHAVVESLVRDLPGQVVHHPELAPVEVAG